MFVHVLNADSKVQDAVGGAVLLMWMYPLHVMMDVSIENDDGW